MKLTGRILVLTEDPTELRAQLDGGSFWDPDAPLHYGVNTDAMISGRCPWLHAGSVGTLFLGKFQGNGSEG